jgi:hypothetical protein
VFVTDVNAINDALANIGFVFSVITEMQYSVGCRQKKYCVVFVELGFDVHNNL